MQKRATDPNSSLVSSADNTNGYAPNSGIGKLPALPQLPPVHHPIQPIPLIKPTPALSVKQPTSGSKTMSSSKIAFFMNPPVPGAKVAQQGMPAAPVAPAAAPGKATGLSSLMGGLFGAYYGKPQQPALAPGGIPGMQAAAKPMAAKPAMPGQPAAPVPGSSPIGSQSVMGANRMANKLKGMGF